MNYQFHYNRLVERAIGRKLVGYSEKHHVIPKCLGGTDEKVNIVRLTPEEHFLAHQLLVKMYPGNRKLILSVKMMTVSGGKVVRNNKMFGWLRKQFSEAMRQQVVSDITRKKMSENAKNRKFSEETRAKMSAARKGKILKKGYRHTDETKQKISEAGKRICKEETKIKISLANKDRILPPISDETRKRLSIKANGRIHERVICPHCNIQGGITGMKRWHFDKCRKQNDKS